MKKFNYEEIMAATNGFSLDLLIGKGSHGRVYKAVLAGRKGGAAAVAVKTPSDAAEPSKLENEIQILSSFRSRHIVNLVGVSITPAGGKQLLVMEYMPNGSLQHLLHSSPEPPSWRRRAAAAVEVARALLALHRSSPPIVHRDVKSANILFDRRWRARLADFSLAAVVDGRPDLPAAGTMGYLDPGYGGPGRVGPAVDVFSFGVVLLELVSGRRAIDVTREPAAVVEWAVPRIAGGRWAAAAVRDRRVELEEEMEGVVEKMMAVAARCVAAEDWQRPRMEEVVAELERALEGVRRPVFSAPVGRMVIGRWVRGWKRLSARRVTTAATKIVCQGHLMDGDGQADERS
ncbi:Serine/threonine-protein kinase-like protein [Apostasia shenzhenica]|uniref:Serine/threonine-protein kinase-like protein n=1 Tax=Apostasia shenzhenica TaxID=1088818 RepID=A0A2H9ZXV8_9ASPA|nr:Serine/threonine-protein kinase-like protein [Apostasia shenzhenica]